MRLINFKNTVVSRDYCTRFLRPGQLLEVHSQKILFPYSRSCKQIFGEFLLDRATPNFLHFRVQAGLLIAVAPRYRYCSGATFTVAVAVAPLLLAESSADGSAATFLAAF